jgi:hypothetical protein
VIDIDGGSGEVDPPQLTYNQQPIKFSKTQRAAGTWAKELFQSMTVSVFRFSTAQVRWSQAELDQFQSFWRQAYKRAEYLANCTANNVFIFPKKWGGEELSTPVNIIVQELCNNIRLCLVHDDVAKSITIQELQQAKDEWMCNTINELYDEMELCQWNTVQHNRWARSLKVSNLVGFRPMWYLLNTTVHRMN